MKYDPNNLSALNMLCHHYDIEVTRKYFNNYLIIFENLAQDLVKSIDKIQEDTEVTFLGHPFYVAGVGWHQAIIKHYGLTGEYRTMLEALGYNHYRLGYTSPDFTDLTSDAAKRAYMVGWNKAEREHLKRIGSKLYD